MSTVTGCPSFVFQICFQWLHCFPGIDSDTDVLQFLAYPLPDGSGVLPDAPVNTSASSRRARHNRNRYTLDTVAERLDREFGFFISLRGLAKDLRMSLTPQIP